jgi:hypothetical protein
MWLIPRSTEIDLTSVREEVLAAEALSEERLHPTITYRMRTRCGGFDRKR